MSFVRVGVLTTIALLGVTLLLSVYEVWRYGSLDQFTMVVLLLLGVLAVVVVAWMGNKMIQDTVRTEDHHEIKTGAGDGGVMKKWESLLKERMPFRYYPVWAFLGMCWMLIYFVLILGLNAIAGQHPLSTTYGITVFMVGIAWYLIYVLIALPVIDLAQRVWIDCIVPRLTKGVK